MSNEFDSPSGTIRATAWLSRGLEALVEDLRLEDSNALPPKTDHFDFAIVGSGYGGAVAAAELSGSRNENNASLKICVLERGQEYLAGSFPSRMADLAGQVRFAMAGVERQRGAFEGLFDARCSSDAVALVANGLGGGSLINAGVMEMPKEEVFKESRWPHAIRRDAKTLIPVGNRLREVWLGANPINKDLNNSPLTKTEALQRLNGGQGFSYTKITVSSQGGPNSANVSLSACLRCGDCATGCNHNAKNSLDLNLLHLAELAGARIFTGATVLRIEPVQDASGGWLIYVNHTDRHLRDRQPNPFVMRSRRVILAAGTFGSTEILMRSSALKLSRQLGRKFSANGDMLVTAYDVNRLINAVADETENPDTGARKIGPTITGMLDFRRGDPQQDVVIEDLAVPGALRRLFEESTTTYDVLNRLADGDFSTHKCDPLRSDDAAVDKQAIGRTLVMAMIARDDADGQLQSGTIAENADGLLTVSWPELRLDSRFEAQHKRLASLLDGRILTESSKTAGNQPLGGRVVNNLLWRPRSDKMESVFGRQRGPLLTVHPLGGCPMGNNVREGVTDCCGRVFRAESHSIFDYYDGLVVLDGSIIPTSLGINPALTIATLALRALNELKSQWGLKGGLLTSTPPLVPASTRPHFCKPSLKANPTKTAIELSEQIRGSVYLREQGGGTKPHMVEITLTTDAVDVEQIICRKVSENRQADPRNRTLEAGRLLTLRNGRLRILRADRNFDPVSDEPRAEDIALTARLNGSIRLFTLEHSSAFTRIFRALWAWFLNRGFRDITQSRFERILECLRFSPPIRRKGGLFQSAWRYTRDIVGLCSRAGAVRLVEYDLSIDSVFLGDQNAPSGDDIQLKKVEEFHASSSSESEFEA